MSHLCNQYNFYKSDYSYYFLFAKQIYFKIEVYNLVLPPFLFLPSCWHYQFCPSIPDFSYKLHFKFPNHKVYFLVQQTHSSMLFLNLPKKIYIIDCFNTIQACEMKKKLFTKIWILVMLLHPTMITVYIFFCLYFLVYEFSPIIIVEVSIHTVLYFMYDFDLVVLFEYELAETP